MLLLHGSETWSVRKETGVAFQCAEMRIVRWMCGIKVRVPSRVEKETSIRQPNLVLVLWQNGLHWYGYVCETKTITG